MMMVREVGTYVGCPGKHVALIVLGWERWVPVEFVHSTNERPWMYSPATVLLGQLWHLPVHQAMHQYVTFQATVSYLASCSSDVEALSAAKMSTIRNSINYRVTDVCRASRDHKIEFRSKIREA